MHVFKLAMKVALRHWTYLLIYVVFLGGMGVAMSASAGAPLQTGAFEGSAPKVAVINRDSSPAADALERFALENGTPVAVEDSVFGLQDAAAKDLASYVLEIPAGFGNGLMEAAAQGEDAPTLETVVSFRGADGSLMDQRVKAYARTLYGFASTTTASQDTVVNWTNDAMSQRAAASYIPLEVEGISSQFLTYASFSTYSLFAACAIFIAVGFAPLNTLEIRRRLGTAPAGSLRIGVQVGLACLVFGLIIWAAVAALGLASCAAGLVGTSWQSVALVLAAQLAFSLVGTAVGFLLWRLKVGDQAANGVGNIFGLVLSFLSGAWVPFDVVGEGVRAAAHFTPSFWAVDAMTKVYEAPALTPDVLAGVAADLGIVLLFAAAIVTVALAITRTRAQA